MFIRRTTKSPNILYGTPLKFYPSLGWLRETRGKMERFSVESCVGGYHVYKARTPLVLAYLNERYWPRFFVVLLPCSLLCSLPPSTHVLRKGTLRIKGTVNRVQAAKKSYKKRRSVRTLARAAVLVENFVGGKIRDT